MYAEDSLFTLSLPGQLGVVAIALLLSGSLIWVAWRFAPRAIWTSALMGLGLFWIYTWLSPQVFYQYFHLLFEDLPRQWVIWPPPGPDKIFELLTFSGRPSLSAHGHGVLGWVLIGLGLLRNSLFRRNAAN